MTIGSTFLLLIAVAPSAGQLTDFVIRSVDSPAAYVAPEEVAVPAKAIRFDIASAAQVASQWGRVTSTKRTFARNRAVGGVPNSFHLSGRAIDVARKPGVRHGQIEAAYRR